MSLLDNLKALVVQSKIDSDLLHWLVDATGESRKNIIIQLALPKYIKPQDIDCIADPLERHKASIEAHNKFLEKNISLLMDRISFVNLKWTNTNPLHSWDTQNLTKQEVIDFSLLEVVKYLSSDIEQDCRL